MRVDLRVWGAVTENGVDVFSGQRMIRKLFRIIQKFTRTTLIRYESHTFGLSRQKVLLVVV